MGTYNLSELTRLPAHEDYVWTGALAADTKAIVVVNSLSGAILVNLSSIDPAVDACDVVVPAMARVVFPSGNASAIALRTTYVGPRQREYANQALVYESDAPLAPRTDYLAGPAQGSTLLLGLEETITAAGSPVAIPDTPNLGRHLLILQAPLANTDRVKVGDYATPLEMWPGDVLILPVHDRIDVWAAVDGADQNLIWTEL